MLCSLLLSPNDKTVRVIGRVFKDLEVDLEHAKEPDTALLLANENHYNAIVIDDDIEDAHVVLKKLTELPTCNESVRIVLAEAGGPMYAVFKTSAQVILYKPLSPERVRQGLRAVRNLMARDRRRGAARVCTQLQAKMSPRYSPHNRKSVMIIDLSESGASVNCELVDVPASGRVNLQFRLPSETDLTQVTAELVWQDHEGRAGLRFIDIPSHARKRLSLWLRSNPSNSTGNLRLAARVARSGQ